MEWNENSVRIHSSAAWSSKKNILWSKDRLGEANCCSPFAIIARFEFPTNWIFNGAQPSIWPADIATVFTKFRAEPEKSGGGGRGGGVGCHESRIHATIPCSDRSAQIILWTSVYSNAESIRMRNGTITTNAYPRMGLFRKEVVIGYLYLLVRSL